MRLKELRKAAHYTQQKLADKLGVARSTVAMWETSETDFGTDMAKRIASLFDVPVDELLEVDRDVSNAGASAKALRVPVLGSIPAGVPIEAIEDILDWEEVPADWGRGGKEYFALKVRGLSMYPRYEDGDVVIFRRQDTCESGQDCAVMVNGNEATFKRVKLMDGGVMLQAINPDYESYMYSNAEWQEKNGQILGVVVELRRKV